MAQPEKPTELIHLPGGSWLPLLVAGGLAFVVLGVYAWWPYSVAGALVALVSLVTWLRGNRDEIARLPRRQPTATSPIPPSPARRGTADRG
jgi:hypothetical protein